MLLRAFVQGICLLFAGALCAQDSAAGAADSLRLALLRLAIRQAEIEAGHTEIWQRLLPRVELSAGFSAGSLFFADPASGGGYLLPKDSYRLSFGLALSGLVDGVAHEKALVHLDRARTELSLQAALQDEARKERSALAARQASLRALGAEDLRLREEVARYQGLLFEQGRCGFDALVRAKLSVLAARSALAGRPMTGDAGGREEP